MKTSKGKIYYYVSTFSKPVVIKLRALYNDSSYTTLAFTIVEYILGTPEDAGSGKLGILDVGKNITSNQLNYVSSEGLDSMITRDVLGIFHLIFTQK